MKKYFLVSGTSPMMALDENNVPSAIDYCSSDIDWIYRVTEDGTLTISIPTESSYGFKMPNIKFEDRQCTVNVKADDVIVKFYIKEWMTDIRDCFMVLSDTQLNKNLKAKFDYLNACDEKRRNEEKIANVSSKEYEWSVSTNRN